MRKLLPTLVLLLTCNFIFGQERTITQVANPFGSEAERTTFISVISEDASITQDYTIVFS